MPLRRTLAFSLLAMLSLWLGCSGGEPRTKVSGKVLDRGQPLALRGADFEEGAAGVEVTFYRLDSAGKVAKESVSYGTRVGKDGSFTLDGPDGKGLPIGKFLVTLRRTGGSGPDPLEAKFSAAATPFREIEVAQGKEVLLDISTAPDKR